MRYGVLEKSKIAIPQDYLRYVRFGVSFYFYFFAYKKKLYFLLKLSLHFSCPKINIHGIFKAETLKDFSNEWCLCFRILLARNFAKPGSLSAHEANFLLPLILLS